MTPKAFTATVSAITSAFGDPTRRAIYLFARENPDGITASQVAGKFDLHANVARHHLDKLAAGGYLEVLRSGPVVVLQSATYAGPSQACEPLGPGKAG